MESEAHFWIHRAYFGTCEFSIFGFSRRIASCAQSHYQSGRTIVGIAALWALHHRDGDTLCCGGTNHSSNHMYHFRRFHVLHALCGDQYGSAPGCLLACLRRLLHLTETQPFTTCRGTHSSERYYIIPIYFGTVFNPHDARNCRDRVIRSLPGNIPPLLPRDINPSYREERISGLRYKALRYESEMVNKGVDYVLINTFEELEGREAAAALSVTGCPAVAIGPVFLPDFLIGRNESIKSSMWDEDESCLEWLDMHPLDSVVYISFGSLAIMSQKQLEEMALGLEASGQPFLWVLRSDLAQGESASLPKDFIDRTKGRALLVSWVPQLKVLSHPSVGGFLTHSGWNSTLESISMGVPMLGWPSLADQSLNCRFAKDVWKVGMDFNELDVDDERFVTKEEVESAVKSLMKSEEGMKVRKTARNLKESAAKAVMAGGSSFENLEAFIQNMRQRTNYGLCNHSQ